MHKKNLYYFISDVHLGLRVSDYREREEKFARFLLSLPDNTAALYLLGDIFDFWYEYKYVIPRGFTRTLGALAFLKERGVMIYFINGNHDVWTFNYLQQDIGVEFLSEMSVVSIGKRQFCLAHGDELAGNKMHLMMKRLFKSKILQKAFSAIHPRWAFAIASRWSKHNRLYREGVLSFRADADPLYRVASCFEEGKNIDYFIFGHMHTPGDTLTPAGAGFYILGEWIKGCEYLIYDSQNDQLTWHRGCNQRNIEK